MSKIIKRTVAIGMRKTSISLEDGFWHSLVEIAAQREKSISGLVSEIDASRTTPNLSSALRMFVLDHYKSRCTRDGKDQDAI